jgi:predicted transcriptional regulator
MSSDIYGCDEAFRLTIPAIRIAIAKAMAAQKISQAEIAKRLGVAQPAVSKYLSGKYSADVRAVENSIGKSQLEDLMKVALAGDRTQISRKIDQLAASKRLVEEALALISPEKN